MSEVPLDGEGATSLGEAPGEEVDALFELHVVDLAVACRVSKQHFSCFHDLYLEPGPESGPGLSNGAYFTRVE